MVYNTDIYWDHPKRIRSRRKRQEYWDWLASPAFPHWINKKVLQRHAALCKKILAALDEAEDGLSWSEIRKCGGRAKDTSEAIRAMMNEGWMCEYEVNRRIVFYSFPDRVDIKKIPDGQFVVEEHGAKIDRIANRVIAFIKRKKNNNNCINNRISYESYRRFLSRNFPRLYWRTRHEVEAYLSENHGVEFYRDVDMNDPSTWDDDDVWMGFRNENT